MISATGIDEAAAQFVELGLRLSAGAPFATRRVAEALERDQKAQVPVRTGYTRSTISADQVSPLEWVVGTDYNVGLFLEGGTVRMSPRPWAFQTVDSRTDELARAVAALIG